MLLSLRAYGRYRRDRGFSGGTHRAVQKAIAGGRIAVVDGKIDSEAADKAWADNSSESHRRGPDAVDPPSPVPRVPGDAPAPIEPPRGPSFAQASAFEKGWKGKLAQLEFQKRAGQLVSAEQVKQDWSAIVLVTRNKLLGLPSKIKEKLPGLDAPSVRVIENLLRECLEEIADGAG